MMFSAAVGTVHRNILS